MYDTRDWVFLFPAKSAAIFAEAQIIQFANPQFANP